MPALQEHNASCAIIELGHLTEGCFALCFWSEQHASSTSRVMWYGGSLTGPCIGSVVILPHHTRHIVSKLSGQLWLLCRSAAIKQQLQVVV